MKKEGGYRKRVGNWGELEAERYLKEKGYCILEKNYRAEGGEIDLIAKDKKSLVFVEVKTSTSDTFGEPEEWVDRRKQVQIGKVAMGYLMAKHIENMDCRFDVVGVIKNASKTEIRHVEDAFWLESDEPENLY